jgi:hypothetical protein
VTGNLSDDCLLGKGHLVCRGCGCVCHWDPVLVEYFRALGREQYPEEVVLRYSRKEAGKMASPIMKHFTYKHLPADLQQVSRPICELAERMDDELPDGPEKSVGLRKLLEAKDAFVRAKL